jgi:hypothetical protein
MYALQYFGVRKRRQILRSPLKSALALLPRLSIDPSMEGDAALPREAGYPGDPRSDAVLATLVESASWMRRLDDVEVLSPVGTVKGMVFILEGKMTIEAPVSMHLGYLGTIRWSKLMSPNIEKREAREQGPRRVEDRERVSGKQSGGHAPSQGFIAADVCVAGCSVRAWNRNRVP